MTLVCIEHEQLYLAVPTNTIRKWPRRRTHVIRTKTMGKHTGMSYSGDQFYKDWRFAIETDFTDGTGDSIPYADNGKQEWGDETKRLTFDAPPSSVVISEDSCNLAVAVEHEVHLFDARDLEFREVGRLVGHSSRVDSLAYGPGRPGILVSGAANDHAGSVPAEPQIIIWNVEKAMRLQSFASPAQDVEQIAALAATTVADSLSVAVSSDNQAQLASAFKMPIRQTIMRAAAEKHTCIHGRLPTSFQSRPFSPDGRRLIYLPGSRPRSNGDDDWAIKVYSFSDEKDMATLSGHRDAIMWVGYSPNGKRIGTVAWDGTSRIWDAETGKQLHLFTSNGQNWTGGFSTNGEYFATTCGDGTISVYGVEDGSEIFACKGSNRWCRALDWSPSHPKWLAVGTKDSGELLLLDVEQKKIIQRRKLSLRRAKVDEEKKRWLGQYLEVHNVRFIARDESEMLVFFTSGDGSAEIYGVGSRFRKVRYARAGTDSYSEGEGKESEDGEVTSKGGYRMETWEGSLNTPGMFVATVDGDAVRIWHKKPLN